MTRREQIWGRLDPAITTLARWADENPDAMRRLLSEPQLRQRLGRVLEELVGDFAVAPSLTDPPSV